MKYILRRQDIHLKDKSTWNNVKALWNNGEYRNAIFMLMYPSLRTKVLTAVSLNEIIDYLETVQNYATKSFEKNLIPVSKNEPVELKVGQIWFRTEKERIVPYTFAQITKKELTFAQITALNITWQQVDKGGW